MTPNRPSQLLAVVFAAVSDTAFAQSAVPVSEREFFEELPVVLSVSRLPQSIADTPGAVTVFDREFIRSTGYRDVSRLLRLVPGMAAINDRAHSPQFAYHGLGGDYSNRVQVLIDGRSVYSPLLLGGADFGGLTVQIEDIERIEVLRGSNSTTYGSNAFLGVINIVTRHSREEPGAAVGVRVGERNLADGFVRYAASGERGSFRISASRIGDAGFDKLVDDQRLGVYSFRGDLQLTTRDELTFQAGFNGGTRVNGFLGTPIGGNGVRNLKSRNAFAQMRWRHSLDGGDEISVGYYRNDENVRENWALELGPPIGNFPIGIDRQSTRDNIDIQHLLTLGRGLRVAYGAEVRRDWVQSENAFARSNATAESSRLARAFANFEWRPARVLVVNAGGMAERYGGKSTRFAPRVFVNWMAMDGQTLRAGYTRAFREPSLFEEKGALRYSSLFPVQRAGPGSLRPERITSREVGWVGQWPRWGTTADIRVFREDLSELIDTEDNTTIPTYVNITDRIRIEGFEAQIRARPWRGTDLLLGGAWVGIHGISPEIEKTAPRAQYNVTWIQRYGGGFSTTLTFAHVGEVRWVGSQPMKSYNYFDARVAYGFKVGRSRAEWAVGVWDLGDRRQEFGLSSSYQPRDPISRLVYTSVRLEL